MGQLYCPLLSSAKIPMQLVNGFGSMSSLHQVAVKILGAEDGNTVEDRHNLFSINIFKIYPDLDRLFTVCH